MKFRKLITVFCILFLSLQTCILAKSFDEQERIFTLLPNLDTPLAVNPYLPSNFVALSKNGSLDLHDWVYLGPKDVVEEYFKNPTSLKQSILRVRLSETVKQVANEKFNVENDELCELMAPLGLKRLFDVRMSWGKYPIYVITAEFQKKMAVYSLGGLIRSARIYAYV